MARMSTSTAKALGEGHEGTLASPWYIAAGCCPETQATS